MLFTKDKNVYVLLEQLTLIDPVEKLPYEAVLIQNIISKEKVTMIKSDFDAEYQTLTITFNSEDAVNEQEIIDAANKAVDESKSAPEMATFSFQNITALFALMDAVENPEEIRDNFLARYAIFQLLSESDLKTMAIEIVESEEEKSKMKTVQIFSDEELKSAFNLDSKPEKIRIGGIKSIEKPNILGFEVLL